MPKKRTIFIFGKQEPPAEKLFTFRVPIKDAENLL